MADIDTNKIANIIADIQQSQKNIEESEDKSKKLQDKLDGELEFAEDERVSMQSLRDELDAYLDELIPDTQQSLSRDYQF